MNILKALEDKKTKQIVTIIGTISIIIATAGVFYWQVSAIELWSGNIVGGTLGEKIPLNNTTWVYHQEESGTISGVNVGQPLLGDYSSDYYNFPVEEPNSTINGTIVLVGDGGRDRQGNLDLFVYDPEGEQQGTSTGSTDDETINLKKSDFESGGSGNWKIEVRCVRGIQINYKLTIDIFYNGTNTTANNTSQNSSNNVDSDNKIIVKSEFLARENQTLKLLL